MNLAAAIIVMAAATYLLRAVPLVAIRRRITNRWLLSFLYYVPYAVLTAMTVPAIIFATRSPVSGVVALGVAVVLALRGRSLLIVAIGAAVSVLVSEAIIAVI